MRRWNRVGSSVVGIAAGLALGAGAAHASCQNPTQGSLCVVSKDDHGSVEIPLKHTEVTAEISGLVASVEVTQTFTNPSQDVIEAVYVFPLPENSAVNDMVMKIGERTIQGLIKEREEARKIYETAKAQGHVTGILEQERPNIFTQSVANIEPGKEILVTIRYLQGLRYDHGAYEFVFPMVVGPRYIPGTPTGRQAGGWSPDTDQVPDGSRITPPVLKPGTRSGHDINVAVQLDAGVPIQGVHSPSHQVDMNQSGASHARIALHPDDTIPNKDFILRYEVAGKKPELALLTHRVDADGYFLLMIQPQAEFAPQEITPKEMVFVLDTSGSMSGEPIAKVKQAMRKALMSMNPDDTFQVIQFNSGIEVFPEKPMANTKENVRQMLSYINGINAGGGTEMLPAIEAALKTPPDPTRLRIVCLMTDGYIGNEAEIFAAIQRHRARARVFAFGVGSSVNRFLVTQAATLGRGDAQVIRQDEPTDPAVQRFYDRIARPFLTDIDIDWGSLQVCDLYPSLIPDLFAEQPVILKGRYSVPGAATITLKGKIAGKPVSFPLAVRLPEREPANESLAPLWARARIEELEAEQYGGRQPDVAKAITELALKHRLMSQYTSFVAVEDRSIVDTNGQTKTVQVPLEMPEGVSYEGVFGEDKEKWLPMGTISSASALGDASLRQAKSYEPYYAERLAAPSSPRGSATEQEGFASVDRVSEVQKDQPVPVFSLAVTTHDARGGERVTELSPSGELWVSERDPSEQVASRRLVRKFTLAELREIWELIDSAGLSQGSGQRFGSGEPLLTLTVSVIGRTVKWDVGQAAASSPIPTALQELLRRLGPVDGVEFLGGSSAPSATPQAIVPQYVR